jgi:thiol-disulfide isomerase/thioredoxin
MPDEPHGDPAADRSRWSQWVIVALVVLAVYAVFQLRPFSGPNPEGPPAINQPLPALELEPLTGTAQPVTLEELRGRVTLINFWATWCPPCLLELPYILDLEGKFHAEPDFRLLSVSCGTRVPEDLEELRANTRMLLKRMETGIATCADPEGKTRQAVLTLMTPPNAPAEAAQSPQPFSLPTTLLVDRKGVIRGLWIGFARNAPEQMEQLITKLLEEPK